MDNERRNIWPLVAAGALIYFAGRSAFSGLYDLFDENVSQLTGWPFLYRPNPYNEALDKGLLSIADLDNIEENLPTIHVSANMIQNEWDQNFYPVDDQQVLSAFLQLNKFPQLLYLTRKVYDNTGAILGTVLNSFDLDQDIESAINEHINSLYNSWKA